MSAKYFESLKPRHSVYVLNKNLPVSKETIVNAVESTLKLTPTSFHSQTNRALVLFDAEHDKLWKDIVLPELKKVAPAETHESFSKKVDLFSKAAGTVLFFEDTDIIEKLQKDFALYAEHFPGFSRDSAGAAQIHLWSALALDKVGGNLQHYNPVIDAAVASEFGVPKNWRLLAQFVFGGIDVPAGEKPTLPTSEVLKVLGA